MYFIPLYFAAAPEQSIDLLRVKRQRTAGAQGNSHVLLSLCYVQLCVKNNFAEKRTKRAVRKKNNKKTPPTLYTHRCLMCTILDGLVICFWLFFMLHLPLFGCWKFPWTHYWFSSHDVNCHTKVVGIVPGSECWHREGHFLHSHALPPQCVSR